MTVVPEIPEGVVDQETADQYLEDVLGGNEPPESQPEAPESEEDEAQPEEDEGPARDDKGRFATPEEPDEGTAEDEPPSQEDPDVEPAAESEEDSGLSEEEWDALPSLQYRADGQAFEIAGSKVEDDGVFIPNDQIPNVTSLLQEGHSHRGSFRQTLQAKDGQIATVQAELEAEKAAMSEISSKLEELISTPGAFEVWIEDQRKNYDLVKAKSDLARSERLAVHERTGREALEVAQQDARDLPIMQNALVEAVSYYGREAGFGEEALYKIYNRHNTKAGLDLIFPKGENGQRSGGNFQSVMDDIQFLSQGRPAQAPAAGEPDPPPKPKKPVRVRPKPPTSVQGASSKETPPPKKAAKPPKFKTAEEADEYLMRGGYNELED